MGRIFGAGGDPGEEGPSGRDHGSKENRDEAIESFVPQLAKEGRNVDFNFRLFARR